MTINCWLCEQSLELKDEGVLRIYGNMFLVYFGECTSNHPNELLVKYSDENTVTGKKQILEVD